MLRFMGSSEEHIQIEHGYGKQLLQRDNGLNNSGANFETSEGLADDGSGSFGCDP